MRILHKDRLEVMDESEIVRLLMRAKSIARRTNGKQRSSAETEICYLQREKEIREMRRQHHQVYLETLRQR
jgi:hypothetical protein